jgi:hypothetical protein
MSCMHPLEACRMFPFFPPIQRPQCRQCIFGRLLLHHLHRHFHNTIPLWTSMTRPLDLEALEDVIRGFTVHRHHVGLQQRVHATSPHVLQVCSSNIGVHHLRCPGHLPLMPKNANQKLRRMLRLGSGGGQVTRRHYPQTHLLHLHGKSHLIVQASGGRARQQ